MRPAPNETPSTTAATGAKKGMKTDAVDTIGAIAPATLPIGAAILPATLPTS